MTGAIRFLTAMLAILAVVLTAGAVGAARGQASVAGAFVICAGQGPVTIAVDADGNPVGPVHWCPDCVMSVFAAPPVIPPVVPRPAEVAMAAVASATSPWAAAQSAPLPQARGPPMAA